MMSTSQTTGTDTIIDIRDQSSANPLVLEDKELHRHYRVGRGLFKGHAELRAVNGASFTLAAGRTLAVVGESGCGKSTLARLVTLIETPTAGSLAIDGVDGERLAGNDQGDAPQGADGVSGSLRLLEPAQAGGRDPRGTARDQHQAHGIRQGRSRPRHDGQGRPPPRTIQPLSAHVLRRPAPAHRHRPRAHALPAHRGGRRAGFGARRLDPRPGPQSAELNLAYLFISHDLSVVRHIADDVMVMYLGRPVEQGPKEVIFAGPRHPYTVALLAATPSVDPKARSKRLTVKGELPSPLDPPSGCAFHKRCAYATEICAVDRPELRPIVGRAVACHHAEQLA